LGQEGLKEIFPQSSDGRPGGKMIEAVMAFERKKVRNWSRITSRQLPHMKSQGRPHLTYWERETICLVQPGQAIESRRGTGS